MNTIRSYYMLSALYFLIYFSIGSSMPLFANYLQSIGLTGMQMGAIGSMGSILMILSPPLFALIGDRLYAHKRVYQLIMLSSFVLSLLMLTTKSYVPLLVLSFIFFIFQRPIIPLMDGLALLSTFPFGKTRLWGSVGFSISVFISSLLSQYFELNVIFIVFSASIALAFILLCFIKIPSQRPLEALSDFHNPDIKNSFKSLFGNKSFLIFLLYTFLYGGTIGGSNNYFGLLYLHLGGSIVGIGVAFLFLTLSEAPFMQWATKWNDKWGIENMLIFSAIVVTARWLWYASGPSTLAILIASPIQGLAYSTYTISYTEFIRKNIPMSLHSTAISLVSSISFGLSGIFILYMAGYLYEFFNAQLIYLLFALSSGLSIFVAMRLKYINQNHAYLHSK